MLFIYLKIFFVQKKLDDCELFKKDWQGYALDFWHSVIRIFLLLCDVNANIMNSLQTGCFEHYTNLDFMINPRHKMLSNGTNIFFLYKYKKYSKYSKNTTLYLKEFQRYKTYCY